MASRLFGVEDDLITGHGLMDEQHTEFFHRLNNLLGALDSGKPTKEIQNFIRFLADYLQTHLTMEEKLMQKWSYPEERNHRDQHGHFRQRFRTIMDEFGSGKYDLPSFVAVLEKEVGYWFLNHIRGVDRSLAAFLVEKGETGSH